MNSISWVGYVNAVCRPIACYRRGRPIGPIETVSFPYVPVNALRKVRIAHHYGIKLAMVLGRDQINTALKCVGQLFYFAACLCQRQRTMKNVEEESLEGIIKWITRKQSIVSISISMSKLAYCLFYAPTRSISFRSLLHLS